MSVSITTNRVAYTGDGSSVNFPTTFPFFLAADLVVLEVTIATGAQVVKALTTDYTVTGGGAVTTNGVSSPSTGTVIANVAPSSAVQWVIYRDPALTQTVTHVDGDNLPAASIDNPLDKLTLLAIRSREISLRSVQQPDSDVVALNQLPPAATRAAGGAGSFMGFDSTGQPTVYTGTGSGASVPVSVAMTPVVEASTLALGRTALGITPNATQTQLDAGTAATIPTSDLLVGHFPHGQCRLSITDTTHLKLSPNGGDKIRIAGVTYSIPSAGVSALSTSCFKNGTAAQALSASTVYWVYAFNNSGTLTLDFVSGSTHAPDTTAGNVGVEIKSGDATRTLVGLVAMDGSSHFVDGGTLIGLLNWFNRVGKTAAEPLTSNQTTTSATYVEISTSMRTSFLAWAEEAVEFAFTGAEFNTSSAGNTSTSIGIDGTTAEDVYSRHDQPSAIGSQIGPIGFSHRKTVTEGQHYSTLLGLCSSGTGTWVGSATAGLRCVNRVTVRG